METSIAYIHSYHVTHYKRRYSTRLEDDDRMSIYMKHVMDLHMTRMGRQLGRKQAKERMDGLDVYQGFAIY